jgi:hypothetical protein
MQVQVLDYVHKSLTRYSDARENQRISASNKLILLLLWARVRRKRVVVMAYGHIKTSSITIEFQFIQPYWCIDGMRESLKSLWSYVY